MQTPAPVCSLAIANDYLFAGCDDGTLRVYSLSGQNNVLKAVRGLGAEVSSIACVSETGTKIPVLWLACGTRVLSFDLQDASKMILTESDATHTIELLPSDKDDDLNEISIDENNSTLAFSTDSGAVGVMDLESKTVKIMKAKHTNVCGSVKFIHSRPRELVSGGYDQTFFHFDHVQGNILSEYSIASIKHSGPMTLAPPFIVCLAVSPNGMLAAGTAEGRIATGRGGIKGVSKKKTRKWNGLDNAGMSVCYAADGPIVGLVFSEPDVLTFCTLLGMLKRVRVGMTDDDQNRPLWKGQACKELLKVNALCVVGKKIIIGGIAEGRKGIIEIKEVP